VSLLDLLILALAAFYAAYAVTATEGPFHCFATLRRIAPLGGLTNCFVCAVLWCGVVFYALAALRVPEIGYVFAGAGAALLAYRYTGGDRV
jgi:hypothetical protein